MAQQGVISKEAEAFDRQVLERVRHGHIPDLRRARPCDYFFNNSWRRPAYVQLDFGEIFELVRDAISLHGPKCPGPVRVLEVGCGPGHISLELARTGFAVTGLDLSPECIAVARRTADEDPWKSERGPLRYEIGDLLEFARRTGETFHAAVFVGALHHFAEQGKVCDCIESMLPSGGLMIAHEPTRDRLTRANVLVTLLIRTLLSAGGGFYERMPTPTDAASLEAAASALEDELACRERDGSNRQSPRDNEAGYAEMAATLQRRFEPIRLEDRYAFFHELIGGLRFDEKTNVAVARSLRVFDELLCRAGVVQPTEFFFVGRKR